MCRLTNIEQRDRIQLSFGVFLSLKYRSILAIRREFQSISKRISSMIIQRSTIYFLHFFSNFIYLYPFHLFQLIFLFLQMGSFLQVPQFPLFNHLEMLNPLLDHFEFHHSYLYIVHCFHFHQYSQHLLKLLNSLSIVKFSISMLFYRIASLYF